jgi:hypothetical protein
MPKLRVLKECGKLEWSFSALEIGSGGLPGVSYSVQVNSAVFRLDPEAERRRRRRTERATHMRMLTG